MAEPTVLYKAKALPVPRQGETIDGADVRTTFIEGDVAIPSGQFFIVASAEQLKYVPANTFYQKVEDKVVEKVNADCGYVIVAE